MMQSNHREYSPGYLPQPMSTDSFLDDWASQLAISQASKRLPRGSHGQWSGPAMRITKPSSANNSPRATYPAGGRRRTTVNDSPTCRRSPYALGHSPVSHSQEIAHPAVRSSRPVSWHPNSQHFYTSQPQYFDPRPQPSYPLLTPNPYGEQSDMGTPYPYLSPMITSYSTNTSPASGFSPLPIAYYQNNVPQYLNNTGACDMPQRGSAYVQGSHTAHGYTADNTHFVEAASCINTPATELSRWDGLPAQGLGNTTPPTPESFINVVPAAPAVTEQALSESMDDGDDDGEILVGMGLYDAPDKYEDDPQLNNYRSSASSLFGPAFRPFEPTGKGLKLEETWEPPQSDDEDEDDSDADQDGESD